MAECDYEDKHSTNLRSIHAHSSFLALKMQLIKRVHPGREHRLIRPTVGPLYRAF